MDILNLLQLTVLSISENEHDILIQVETNTPTYSLPSLWVRYEPLQAQ